jgi:hypothetical protein
MGLINQQRVLPFRVIQNCKSRPVRRWPRLDDFETAGATPDVRSPLLPPQHVYLMDASAHWDHQRRPLRRRI